MKPEQPLALRNGTKEMRGLVVSTILALDGLMEREPLAVFDFARACKDQGHRMMPRNLQIMRERLLVEPDGTIDLSIRNIVQSAFVGEGLEMRYDSAGVVR